MSLRSNTEVELELNGEAIEIIRESWQEDRDSIMDSWKEGDNVIIFSNTFQKWVNAVIVETDEEEEMLVVEFEFEGSSGKKEIDRYGDRVRPPYCDIFPFDDADSDTSIDFSASGELESESIESSSEEEEGEEDESYLHKKITIDVYGAGTEEVNGRYKRDVKEDPFLYKLDNSDLDMYITPHPDNEDYWVMCNGEEKIFYLAEEEEYGFPPTQGWNTVEGTIPVARVNLHILDLNEPEKETSEASVPWDVKYMTEIKMNIKRRPLGLSFLHFEGRYLQVSEVEQDSYGNSLDIRENDIILKINGEEILTSEKMNDAVQNLKLPFEITLLRAKANMPVLDVMNCGSEICKGRYTIAGNCLGDWVFRKNDDPDYKIFRNSKNSWALGTDHTVFYTADNDPDADTDAKLCAPANGWQVVDGQYPVCNVRNYSPGIEPPAAPVITKYEVKPGKISIHFTCDRTKMIPVNAPRMASWFRIDDHKGIAKTNDEENFELDLKNGEEYTFRVRSANQVNMSKPVIVGPVTPLAIPKAVLKKSDLAPDNESIIVNYNNSEGKKKDVQAKFSIEVQNTRTGEIKTVDMDKPGFVLSGLENDIDHKCVLIAKNRFGSSRSEEQIIQPHILKLKPSVPVFKDVINVPEKRCVELHFECDDLNHPEVDAKVHVSCTPKAPSVERAQSSPIILTNLICGQAYQFGMCAINRDHKTENPELSKHIIPLWVPPRPKIVNTKVTGTNISVEWQTHDNALHNLRGEFIVTVKEKTGKANIDRTTRKPASRRRAVIRGLQPGYAYEIVVTSVNDMGESEPSKTKVVTIGHEATSRLREASLSKYNRAVTRIGGMGIGLQNDKNKKKAQHILGVGWNDDMVYQGYITKKGGSFIQNWKRRFFILYGSRTFDYFDKPNGSKKGSGQFQGGVNHKEQSDGTVIFYATDSAGIKRNWHFQFENTQEKSFWQQFAENPHYKRKYNNECNIHVPEKNRKKSKAKSVYRKKKMKRNKKMAHFQQQLQKEMNNTEIKDETDAEFEAKLKKRKVKRKRSTLRDLQKALSKETGSN